MSDAESPFGQDLSDLLEFDDADSAFHEHGAALHALPPALGSSTYRLSGRLIPMATTVFARH